MTYLKNSLVNPSLLANTTTTSLMARIKVQKTIRIYAL